MLSSISCAIGLFVNSERSYIVYISLCVIKLQWKYCKLNFSCKFVDYTITRFIFFGYYLLHLISSWTFLKTKPWCMMSYLWHLTQILKRINLCHSILLIEMYKHFKGVNGIFPERAGYLTYNIKTEIITLVKGRVTELSWNAKILKSKKIQTSLEILVYTSKSFLDDYIILDWNVGPKHHYHSTL